MFTQDYIPNYSYCVICGVETKAETCSQEHRIKLEKIRFTINEQKGIEKQGKVGWNLATVHKFNKLQELIGDEVRPK